MSTIYKPVSRLTRHSAAYAYWRSRGCNAVNALANARDDAVSSTKRYGTRQPIGYNPPLPNPLHGKRHVRWVENVETDGLRLVGYVDQIRGGHDGPAISLIDHTGWYTDEDGSNGEYFRGVVYQLPSRHGERRYAYGYADPNNDGCALLSFDPCDDLRDAIHWADAFAMRCAGDERKYQEAWQAGNRYVTAGEAIQEYRAKAKAIRRELRTVSRSARAIRATLREALCGLRERSREAHEDRERLASDYGRERAFQDVVAGRA